MRKGADRLLTQLASLSIVIAWASATSPPALAQAQGDAFFSSSAVGDSFGPPPEPEFFILEETRLDAFSQPQYKVMESGTADEISKSRKRPGISPRVLIPETVLTGEHPELARRWYTGAKSRQRLRKRPADDLKRTIIRRDDYPELDPDPYPKSSWLTVLKAQEPILDLSEAVDDPFSEGSSSIDPVEISSLSIEGDPFRESIVEPGPEDGDLFSPAEHEPAWKNPSASWHRPVLQGATNGTIGPQGQDATVIVGVRAARKIVFNPFHVPASKARDYDSIIARAREIERQLHTGCDCHISDHKCRRPLASLYQRAALLAPDKSRRHLCLGKAALFRKSWLAAWRHFEQIYENIEREEWLVREIAHAYIDAKRDAESCIWLTRHMKVASCWTLFEESDGLRSEIENRCYAKVLANESKLEGEWTEKHVPIKVWLPEPESSVQEEFKKQVKHAFFSWMRTAAGKLRMTYVDRPETADIKVVFRDRNTRYSRLTLTPGRLPALEPRPRPFGIAHLRRSATEGTYKSLPFEPQLLVEFFLDGTDYSEEQLRAGCLHEVGHALGLVPHSKRKCDLMYPFLQFSYKEDPLSDYDRRRFRDIYAKHSFSQDAYNEYMFGLKGKAKQLDARPKVATR